MQAYRIEWTEAERGWGIRPNGYSLHVTLEAAQKYLMLQYDTLLNKTPAKFSFPSTGWREPAIAIPIEVSDNGLLATELAKQPNIRIFHPFIDAACEREYSEANSLKILGEPVSISYGEKGYSSAEQELLSMRAEIADKYERGLISPERAVAESQAIIKYLGFGES